MLFCFSFWKSSSLLLHNNNAREKDLNEDAVAADPLKVEISCIYLDVQGQSLECMSINQGGAVDQ